jgi:ABC-2 type transport system permease protein
VKIVRLFGIGFALSLRRTVDFRVNLVFDLLLAVVALLSTIAATLVIFSHTNSLAGWAEPQMLVLIGTFEPLSGIKAAFADPGLAAFPTRGVRDGGLDHQLLRPASSMFLVSLSTATPLAGLQIPLGALVVAISVSSLSGCRDWICTACTATPGSSRAIPPTFTHVRCGCCAPAFFRSR